MLHDLAIWTAIIMVASFTIVVVINSETKTWIDWYMVNNFVECMLQVLAFLFSLLTSGDDS
jgi:hypothetical protein